LKTFAATFWNWGGAILSHFPSSSVVTRLSYETTNHYMQTACFVLLRLNLLGQRKFLIVFPL